jgi:preprotein translocase subunit YajC
MGTTTQILAAAEAAKTTARSSSSFLFIIVIFAVMMIFLFRSQRRRQRSVQNTQSQVMSGTRIRTTFGVYGTVIESDDRNVIVEIAPGIRIKMLKQAIAAVVPNDEPDGVAQTMPTFGETDSDTGDNTGSDLNGDGTSGKPDNRSDLTI